MKNNRRLRLNTEHLSELTPDELSFVAGAINQPTPVIKTLPISDCLLGPTHQGTCYCPPPATD